MERDQVPQCSADEGLSPSLMIVGQLLSDHVVATQASGERGLGWAVFTDGLEQYWQLARHPSAWHSARFQAEEEWVFADDREYPLSFINLCETFSLKADEVRGLLLAWKHAHGAFVGQVLPQM